MSILADMPPPKIVKELGWIGVDLDGTLAMYHSWDGTVGEPIPRMLARVKEWLEYGREVRIVTARVGTSADRNEHGVHDNEEFASWQRGIIEAWCLKHIGQKLQVTATKDFKMTELWDDRAIQVITNTGLRADGKQ